MNDACKAISLRRAASQRYQGKLSTDVFAADIDGGSLKRNDSAQKKGVHAQIDQ